MATGARNRLTIINETEEIIDIPLNIAIADTHTQGCTDCGEDTLPSVAHNELGGLQGGNADERYHISGVQWRAVNTSNSPSETNPFVTIIDLSGAVSSAFYQRVALNGTNILQRPRLNFSSEFTAVDNTGTTSSNIGINTIAWNKIITTPTTVAGYGITNVYTKTESDGRYEPVITAGATTQYLRGDKTWQTLLDGGGKIISSLLPSYVDDVLEFANFAALPTTGETGKIYVTLNTNKIYRWSGSTYIELVPSVGTTDALVEGTTNLYYTNARVAAYGDTHYYPLSSNPAGYLTSFTESDPTVPSYAKSLTSFSVIKAFTDVYYQPLENQRLSTTNNTTFNSLITTNSVTAGTGVSAGGYLQITSGLSGYSNLNRTMIYSLDNELTFTNGYASRFGLTFSTSALTTLRKASWQDKDGTVAYLGDIGITSFNTRTGAVTLTSGDVTTALGYTPYNSTNPNGYISGNQTITLSGHVTGSGTTAITTTIGAGVVTNTMLAGSIADSKILSAATWNAKQNAITLTTSGTSGAATFDGTTLNIPSYTGGGGGSGTVSGTAGRMAKFTDSTTVGNSAMNTIEGGSTNLLYYGVNTHSASFTVIGSGYANVNGSASVNGTDANNWYVGTIDSITNAFGASGDMYIGTPTDATHLLGKDSIYLRTGSSGTLALTINTSQVATFASAVYGTGFFEASQRHLKDNIKPYTRDALSAINTLQVKTFNFKNLPTQKRIGFIVDEIEGVNDELLNEEKTAISKDNLLAQLTKAVQELSKEVEDLKCRLGAV